MPQYGTWLSFAGAARIGLAVGSLAAAGGLACAGIGCRCLSEAPGPAGRP